MEKNKAVRKMHRHIKVKECPDFKYEDSKESIFKVRVNRTQKTNKMSSKVKKNEEHKIVNASTNQDSTPGTTRETNRHAKQGKGAGMEARVKECVNISEAKSSKILRIKKEVTNSTSFRGTCTRTMKRKKDTDSETYETAEHSRNKRNKLDKLVKIRGSEDKKTVKGEHDKNVKVGEGGRCNSRTRSNRRVKHENDNDFEYYDTAGVSNKSELDEEELTSSSAKEQEDQSLSAMEDDGNEEFATSEKLSNQEVFTCDVCNKIVLGKAYFEKHKMSHIVLKQRKVHKCSYEGCSKKFNDTSNLKKHVDTVHLNIRNYLCEFCVSRFKTLGTLKAHIASHHSTEDRKRFSCDICGKAFVRKVGLQMHESLHTDTKSFTCSFEGCGKTFRLKNNLTKHENVVHKDLKPHQCNFCEERFSRKTYLDTHMYKHTGIKAFSCKVCAKSFSQNGNLRTHMLLHNKKRTIYNCPECFQTFNFKSNMTKHLQKHIECTYRRASAYINSQKAELIENNGKNAETKAGRYERKTVESEEQKGNSEQKKVLVTPSAVVTLEKRGKNKSIFVIIKQVKGSQNDKNIGEQFKATAVQAVNNYKVEGNRVVEPTKQMSVACSTGDNSHAVKEKGNDNMDKNVLTSNEEECNIEEVESDLEKALTSVEDNSEISLTVKEVSDFKVSENNSSGVISNTENEKGSLGGKEKNSQAVTYVCIEDVTECSSVDIIKEASVENEINNTQNFTEGTTERSCLKMEDNLIKTGDKAEVTYSNDYIIGDSEKSGTRRLERFLKSDSLVHTVPNSAEGITVPESSFRYTLIADSHVMEEGEVGGALADSDATNAYLQKVSDALVDRDATLAYLQEAVKTSSDSLIFSESNNSAVSPVDESETIVNDIANENSEMHETLEKTNSIVAAFDSLPESQDKIIDPVNSLALQSRKVPGRRDKTTVDGVRLTVEFDNDNHLQGNIMRQVVDYSCNENQNDVLLNDHNQFTTSDTSIQNISVPESHYQQMLEQVELETDTLKPEESDSEVKIEVEPSASVGDAMTNIGGLIVMEENVSEHPVENF